MRIFEICPFNDENLIAGIKMGESKNFVSELHVTEANRTFRFEHKDYAFAHEGDPMVRYHKIDGDLLFVGNVLRLKRNYPFITKDVNPWKNEATQRNFATTLIEPEDNDIVVLSDIDEIISEAHWEKLISETLKRGIVTVGLHFSLYYFNLFSSNWPGPPDYSYRLFSMTGKHFKNLKMSSDQLRKMGEKGSLKNSVHRIPGFMGFHHSWLGDTDTIAKKLSAYSHSKADHSSQIYEIGGGIDKQEISKLLRSNSSLFGAEHKLIVRNDIPLLGSVEQLPPEILAKYLT